MKIECKDCGGELNVPEDVVVGEIVSCPDCGSSYELVKIEGGFTTKPAQVVGEDWGQ